MDYHFGPTWLVQPKWTAYKSYRKIDIYEKQVDRIYKRHRKLRIKDALTLENCKMAYRLEHQILPTKLLHLFNTNQKGKCLKKLIAIILEIKGYLTWPRHIVKCTTLVFCVVH